MIKCPNESLSPAGRRAARIEIERNEKALADGLSPFDGLPLIDGERERVESDTSILRMRLKVSKWRGQITMQSSHTEIMNQALQRLQDSMELLEPPQPRETLERWERDLIQLIENL